MANTVKLDSVCPGIYGISVRRYQQLAKEGLVPPSEDGHIDFIASTKALVAYYQKLLQGKGSITLVEENARLTKIKADMAMLDYQKRLGNLLEKDEVVRAWSGQITAARSKLLAIPAKVTPALDGLNRAERKQRIEEMLHEAMADMSEMTSDDIKQAVVKLEHFTAAGIKAEEGKGGAAHAADLGVKAKEKNGKGHNVKKHNVKKKVKKLCALCLKKEIDRRARLCKRCASLERERMKKEK